MGKIIRNGIEFSGACEDATAVNYDNSLSGLEAQTVQEGIDELSKSLIKYKMLKANVSGFTLDGGTGIYYKNALLNQFFNDSEFPSNIVALIPLNGNFSGYVCNFTIWSNEKNTTTYINAPVDGTYELRLGVLYI